MKKEKDMKNESKCRNRTKGAAATIGLGMQRESSESQNELLGDPHANPLRWPVLVGLVVVAVLGLRRQGDQGRRGESGGTRSLMFLG